MSNEVSRSNQMINKTTIGDKFKTYLKHPGSFILMLFVMLAALVTFAVLIFLIAYILINGLPHIKPSLFSLEYSSENASVVPAFVNTIVMTLLSLLIAVPFGIFLCDFSRRVCEERKQIHRGHPADDRDAFRHSVYRIRTLRYAVLCKCSGVGLLPAGRRLHHSDHDPSADHENDRGSAESSS